MTARFCSDCGHSHDERVRFCENCGADLLSQAGAASGAQGQSGVAGSSSTAVAQRPRVITLPPGPPTSQGPPAAPASTPPPQAIQYVPPPKKSSSTTTWIIAAAAVVLLVVGGVVIALLTRDDTSGPGETLMEAPPVTTEVPPAEEAAAPTEPAEAPEATVPEAPEAADDDKPALAPGDDTVALGAAGVDFSWLALPAAASYTDWEWVTDDSGALTVELPMIWSDRILALDSSSGVAVPTIWAAPDLVGLIERWDGAGAIVESHPPTGGTTAEVLAAMSEGIGAADSCPEARTFDYDDGWYVGSAVVHAGCGSADSALLQIAAADGTAAVLQVQVQMVSTADVEAAERVIRTFQTVATVPAPVAPAPVPAPAPAPAPAPVPAPAPAEPALNSLGMPVGLYCRDMNSMGYSYAQTMDYYYAEGSPDRMDADLDGIPCETVFPSWEIDAYWGFGTAPVAPPVDQSAEALWIAEDAMYFCGYSPALDSYIEGPFPDGGYTVSMTVDVGWDLIWAQFEVLPGSGEIYGFDATAEDLLWCNY